MDDVEPASPPIQADLVSRVGQLLETDDERARAVVSAFWQFVAEPLGRKFTSLRPVDIARRNPFAYAALGVTSMQDWFAKVLVDMLSSAVEGLIGNWMEEVARIMCNGTKPGSGVDLQRDLGDGVVELYAIQSTTNTKNAGGRRSDLRSLEAAAGALRAQRRHVDLFVGYMFGRRKTTVRDNITHLSSVEFWERLTGDRDFLPKLLHACADLSELCRAASPAASQIADETRAQFGVDRDGIDWAKVLGAAPPPRRLKPPPAGV